MHRGSKSERCDDPRVLIVLEFARLDGFVARNHRLFVFVAPHGTAHIQPIFRPIVIEQHSPIDNVAQLLVHLNGHSVRGANEQIDEESVVHGLGDVLEQSHELAGQFQSTILRCHRDGCDMTVPILPLSFGLA